MEASGPPPQAPPQAPPLTVQPTTDDLLRAVLAEQQQHRAEVAALRDEINSQKPPAPPSQTPLTPEEAFAARMREISDHDYYCPGCGLVYDYRQRCSGSPERPHPPIEVVSTDELKAGDPSKHTAPVYV